MPIRRDLQAMPPPSQDAIRRADQQRADALVRGIQVADADRRRLRAAAGHVVRYWTWRSLRTDEGLSHHEAVALAVGFVNAATECSQSGAVTDVSGGG